MNLSSLSGGDGFKFIGDSYNGYDDNAGYSVGGADINGDGRMDLALPSNHRRTLRIVGFADRVIRELALAELPSRIDKAIAVRGSNEDVRFVVGLENAEVYEVHR